MYQKKEQAAFTYTSYIDTLRRKMPSLMTERSTTQGELIPMKSIYALWMSDDILNLVVSCPSKTRRLKNGRWREARELSIFPGHKPLIKIKVRDAEAAKEAVEVCRKLHPEIKRIYN